MFLQQRHHFIYKQNADNVHVFSKFSTLRFLLQLRGIGWTPSRVPGRGLSLGSRESHGIKSCQMAWGLGQVWLHKRQRFHRKTAFQNETKKVLFVNIVNRSVFDTSIYTKNSGRIVLDIKSHWTTLHAKYVLVPLAMFIHFFIMMFH